MQKRKRIPISWQHIKASFEWFQFLIAVYLLLAFGVATVHPVVIGIPQFIAVYVAAAIAATLENRK
jgi:hypothetical protein